MDSLFQLHQIGNLEVAISPISSVESCSIGVYIPVGSRHESADLAGISHFLEHMIFKGTTQRSAVEIAVSSESKGITMNAYTTEDHTLLEMRGLSSSSSQMIELITEMLWHSTFPEAELESEANVIKEEIIEYQESPNEHIYDILSSALWPNHSLGRPITGTIDSVRNIKRTDILDFHLQQYSNNIKVAVAGNINVDSVIYDISKYFPTHLTKNKIQTSTPQTPPKSIIEYRDTDQANIAIAYPIAGRLSDDRHIHRIISLILGETMSSLLFQKIREELGICYTIQSDVSLFEDIGSINIVAALNAEKHQFALDAIHQTINDFMKNGPSTETLANAKQFAIIQNQLALEGSQSYMQWIGDSITCYGRIITPDEAKQSLENVSLDHVMQSLDATFSKDFAYAAILPEDS